MSVKIRSVRYTFQKVDNKYELKQTVPGVSVTPPTDTTDVLENVTGTWAELLDGSGRVLYRRFIYAMLHSVSEDEFRERNQFDLLLPYLPDAKTVRLYAPPPRENGIREVFGDESEIIGEYPVPTLSLQSAGTEPALPCDICGEGRGKVTKKTLLRGTGNKCAYNLILLADKFTDTESLKSFVDGAIRCVNFLFSHPPFDTVMGYRAMNVWYVEIETYDKSNPYFHVAYDSDSTHVEWCSEKVKEVCDALFSDPGWTYAGILIKEDNIHLGTARAADRQFAMSLFNPLHIPFISSPTPEGTFQHEFGHTAFSLADEYGGKGKYEGSDPRKVNVTTVTQRDELPWKSFVEDSTPLPTPDSFYGDNPDKVGCYEGGYTYDSGIYRPQLVCVMRNHWDKRTRGHYCKVCMAQARYTLTGTLDAHIPIPGILYYSRSKQSWENIKIASDIEKRYEPSIKGYERFRELLNELTRGGTVGKEVKELFKRYKVDITEGTVTSAGEGSTEGMQTWFVNDGSGKLYYIITDNIYPQTLISVGYVKIPKFFDMMMFDGISLGVEQHVFCLTDGELQRGIMGATGEIGDFVKQDVPGLTQDLEGISVSYKNGSAAIYVAVMSEYKVKLGTYLNAASSWDPHGFIDMPEDDGSAYEFVKIMNVKNNVYVLAKNASGIVIRIFDPVNMVWREGMTAKIADTESALQADWAYYQNKAYLTYIYDDHKIASKSVELTGDSVQVTDCLITYDSSSFQGVITSFGTTVCDNDLHVIYTLDRKAMHSIFRFKFDYNTNKYGLEFSKTLQITSPGFEKYAVQSLSAHNNDSVIYLILSCDGELTLSDSN